MTRAVCLLCVALMCVIGAAQAAHAHSGDSADAHHACSLCATAHAGVSTQPFVVSPPVLAALPLLIAPAEVFTTFRPLSTHFIRPPPAL